jgi:hypothetical protein
MTFINVKVHVKNRFHMIQENPSASIEDTMAPLLRGLYNQYVNNRAVIMDDQHRIINGEALIKWFNNKTLYVTITRSDLPFIFRSPLTRNRMTVGVHSHIFLTYTRGTKILFKNRWVVNSRYIRIECVIGETIMKALRRDRRLKIHNCSVVQMYWFVNQDTANFQVTYQGNHVITRELRGVSFAITRIKRT